jgi:TPR repeat protein
VVADEVKRLRLALESVTDNLLCPITQKLPIDPVTAEDSRVYEASAIEKWFERPNALVRSPVTNEPMGRLLKPALVVRNMIEDLVTTGAITGDKADSWKERLALKNLRQRAAAGQIKAMLKLGASYLRGHNGLSKDVARAFAWLKQASDLREVKAVVQVGVMYCHGQGVTSSVSRGATYLSQAVELGSDVACYEFGRLYQEGICGFEKDAAVASFYYSKVQGCTFKHLPDAHLAKAVEWLQAHPVLPTTRPSD